LLCQEEQFYLYSKMSDPELLNSGAFCLLEQRPPEVGDVWKLSILQFVAVGVGCLALGYWVGKKRSALRHLPLSLEKPKYHGKEQTHDVEKLAEKFEDFKMVLVVRNDLKMGKGKVAAQCSHATLGLYKKVFHRAPKALQRWEMCSQVKVVTKVESEEEMLSLQNRAKSMKLPCHITIDAGRTQIAPNSRTVMAILGPSHLVDEVTGSLKLL
jgi:PTH2 family peptidyl-tRNA hydrolase